MSGQEPDVRVVYALEACDYEDHSIIGVFPTLAAAEAYRERVGVLQTWATGHQSWVLKKLDRYDSMWSYDLNIREVNFYG